MLNSPNSLKWYMVFRTLLAFRVWVVLARNLKTSNPKTLNPQTLTVNREGVTHTHTHFQAEAPPFLAGMDAERGCSSFRVLVESQEVEAFQTRGFRVLGFWGLRFWVWGFWGVGSGVLGFRV